MSSALSHPRLADCRRLFLRNYEVLINIGVYDFEKKGEQIDYQGESEAAEDELAGQKS